MTKYAQSFAAFAATLFAVLASTSAFAGADEANAAVSRADAKVEIVGRHSSQPGIVDDQSFDQSRQKLTAAHASLKSHDYDSAEMLADEASALAELTAERAKLAVLRTSRTDVANAAQTNK